MMRTLILLLGIVAAQAAGAEETKKAPSAPKTETATTGPATDGALAPDLGLGRATFAENGRGSGVGWTFGFHGYARMPLRVNSSFSRSPYLVDDDYFLSGFAYTRLSEREWIEAFFSAEKGKTRFVLGLFASQLSDWSETTLQGQGGVATAFVEHEFGLSPKAKLGARMGMFWDRHGYTGSYDTYLLGRMHIAGLRLKLTMWDRWYTKLGIGAHAEVINANQGFTPVFYFQTGVNFGWIDASFFTGVTWTSDSEREFSIIEDGSLKVYGGEVRVAIPHAGPLSLLLSFLSADKVVFLSNAFEVLHSTGGRGLTQSFFGPDSENGTGEILMSSLEFTWQLSRTFAKLFGAGAARAVRGLDWRFFGMLAWVASKQRSEDPLKNFDNRVYYKWGMELVYRIPALRWLWASLRYDRVILDTSHESLSFRAVTPRVGVTPIPGWNLDLFLAYSRYFYGDRVQLRPNQIPGDTSVTTPDVSMLKIQAQVSW